MTIDDYVREASLARAKSIDHALRSLLLKGVRASDIDVQEHPDNRTVITVNGVPKYEIKVNVVTGKT
jgi:hypothetical protein